MNSSYPEQTIIEFKDLISLGKVISEKRKISSGKPEHDLWVDEKTYYYLNTHKDFSPGSLATPNIRKARFNEDGQLIRFDGTNIKRFSRYTLDYYERLCNGLKNILNE